MDAHVRVTEIKGWYGEDGAMFGITRRFEVVATELEPNLVKVLSHCAWKE